MSRHRPHSLIVNRGRRRFLAGAAGVLALPFLESVGPGPRAAQAWTAATGMPQRLIIFFNGHGLIMEEFVPRTDFTQGAILNPVADAGLAEKMLVVTGIDNKIRGGHDGAPALLSCTSLVENEFGITHATTPTVDHVIARHMQDGGLARRFDVGLEERSLDPGFSGISQEFTQISWSGRNEVVDTLVKPQLAYDTAFPGGTSMSGGTTTETSTDLLAVRRRSVLDGVLRQFTTLRNRVSLSDRERLDSHAEKLREIEQSLETTMTTTRMLPPSCDGGPDLGELTGLTYRRLAETQVDILAHAMACGRADVGSFRHFDLPEIAWNHISHPDMAATFSGEGYHGAWHRAADDDQDYARRAFTAINTSFGTLFARLLSNLEAIDEGSGTALDNTMVLWLSDFGHGGGHSSGNLPLVFAGNAGGARLGRHVDFSNNGAAEPWEHDDNPGNHNLAVTLTQAFGIAGDRFGDYGAARAPVSPGPLSL